jgi:predicted RNA binding protein YcfA (HicA-like mRNA interferase family)
MPKSPLRNIPLKTFREYLKWNGLIHVRTNGGHEIWKRDDLYRTISLPTHVNPVSEMVVKSIMKTIGTDATDYIKFLEA